MLEGVEVSLHDLQLPCLGRCRVGGVGVPGRDPVQLKGRVVGRCTPNVRNMKKNNNMAMKKGVKGRI